MSWQSIWRAIIGAPAPQEETPAVPPEDTNPPEDLPMYPQE